MPRQKAKAKYGAPSSSSKKLKVCEPCNLNPDLVKSSDKYHGIISGKDGLDDECVTVNRNPFTSVKIKNLLDPGFLDRLKAELGDLELVEKNNDLYKFHQSGELNNVKLPMIKSFKTMLLQELKPILSKMTGAELDDRLALFCARYDRTDYLLCHDDELEGRRIAFIMYLVPPWGNQDGGLLELFNTDESGNPSEVITRLVPENNSLVFFEVSAVSFHQVSEVLADKTRLSLGGWFHGTSLPRPEKPLLTLEEAQSYVEISEDLFFSFVNPLYLNPETQAEIQEKFEESSEISLPDFILPEKFATVAEELKNLQGWEREGPANRRNVWSIKNYSEANQLGNAFNFMRSEPFFLLLSNLTGLKLHSLAPDDSDSEETNSEPGECNPKWKGRIRKWTQGTYSLVRDDDLGLAEFALDARICFNVSAWSPAMGGQTVYIARGEDEHLVTVEPENNSLNLVYRDKESLRFVKYVNSEISENGPFHDLDFTYYE